MDKEFQSAAESLREITARKKPIRRVISKEDEQLNKELSSDRILVEKYFGRVLKLWTILSANFLWSIQLYDTIFALGFKFTSYNFVMSKLRDDDGLWYYLYRDRMLHIGESNQRKRAESLEKHRTKRKQRLGIGFRSKILGNDDTEQEY